MSSPKSIARPPGPDRVFGEAARRIDELERLNAELRRALADKQAAELAHARSEAHFRASFESDAVGQLHQDPVTGVIIRANRCFAKMLGYEPEELVGRAGTEFTWPEDRARAPWERLVAGRVETYSREKRYLRRDGTPVWGRVSASLVREPGSSEPLLAVAVVEDIDDRKKAELALARTMSDLERVVEERTAALAQRDLLLREVYHRVKNNLQIVESLLHMQARRLGDGPAGDALSDLRGRIYALGLVHHQLMGSDDLETFDIAPFLDDLSRHLVMGSGHTGVELTVTSDPLRVGLDQGIPLGLVMTELVTNSIKHAFPDGRGTVTVSLTGGADGSIALEVADDGCGYDPDPAASTLGATIIQGLVRQLRGTISVRSDGGVTTRVTIPGADRR